MKYFKNTELASIYHVSEKSVRNWIAATEQGKLNLQLFTESGRSFIADTANNTVLIEKLVDKGRKFKNSRGQKAILPTKHFYEIFGKREILDVISNMTFYHEIPLMYTYVDGGATYWDKFACRLFEEESPNILKNSIELLDASLKNIEKLLEGKSKVNIVDLGPGNVLPMRDVIARLLDEGRLNRYIAIDISEEMLRIAKSNIKEWFGDKVHFEGYVKDFSHERFDDLFADDCTESDDMPVNLVTLLGGTLSNLRAPDQALQTINDSLAKDDLLVYTDKLDTPNTRRFFDFTVPSHEQQISPRHRLIVDLLNIDESFYDAEQIFDSEKQARIIRIRPNVDIIIKFDFENGTRRIELLKGEAITLWRAWAWSALDLIKAFDKNGFDLMQALKSKDQEFIILISKHRVI